MNSPLAVLSLAIALAFAGGTSAATTQAQTTTTTTRVIAPGTPATPATPAMPAMPASPPVVLSETTETVAPATPATPTENTEAEDPMTEADVRSLMIAHGYTKINDVKFKGGSWTADGTSADGKHVEVRIDSASGEIYPDEPVAGIGRDAIIVKVQAAGYTNVHGVEMEKGVWTAEADDSKGNDVELKLDPNDGHVIGVKNDEIGGGK